MRRLLSTLALASSLVLPFSAYGESTLSIIKPEAVREGHMGEIITMFERGGLTVSQGKMIHLTEEQAADFYAVHKDRPFFKDLVKYMTSGPVFVQVLEGDNAVKRNREIMGATNPKEATEGTIRARFAESIQANAVHGSDSLENAEKEIAFFFSKS